MLKVSVLVYVLNDVKNISKCMKSVMNQTLKEIEILVIDGGSKDGTKELINEMAQSDSRIRIISCNPGVGLQFNRGLLEAKGEYIGICESDDYLLPDMYEHQYNLAHQYQLDMLRADARHFCEVEGFGEVVFPVKLSNSEELYNCILDSKNDFRVLRLGINGFWSGLYRRNFLLEQKIFMNETKGATYQDVSFYFFALIKAKRVMFSKDAFYSYRLDNPNSSVNNPQKIDGLIEEYRLLRNRLEYEGLFDQYKEIYWSWKISGFCWFYMRLSKALKKEYIRLVYKEICSDLTNKDYQGIELQQQSKELVKKIELSEDEFEKYMEAYATSIDRIEDDLGKIKHDCDVIIFGSGNIGKLIYLYLLHKKIEAKAFADNDGTKWGGEIENILVESPNKIAVLYPQAFYIVANARHYQEMKEQLIQLGVEKNNIILCSNYAIMKNVLLKSLRQLDCHLHQLEGN